MNPVVTLQLPFPPSVNTYWRHVSLKGRGMATIISERGRKYRKEVMDFMAMRPPHRLNSRLEVHIKLTMPDRRRRDLDNYFKALLDALTHSGVWLDDEQIDILQVSRLEIESPGCARVEIYELPTIEETP